MPTIVAANITIASHAHPFGLPVLVIQRDINYLVALFIAFLGSPILQFFVPIVGVHEAFKCYIEIAIFSSSGKKIIKFRNSAVSEPYTQS